MKKTFAVLVCLALSWFAAAANAQLVVEITRSAEDAVPIAVVPFGWESSGTAPFDVAEVVRVAAVLLLPVMPSSV